MALPNLNVVAMPRNGALHDLPVYPRVAAKLTSAGPFFKIEKIAEELKDIALGEQA